MRWLSESYEEMHSHCGGDVVHEAVIVGSGYGGAVAALRLAQAGFAPLVLERGNEFLAGEFPNDAGELPAHVRLSRWGEERVTGYESGLFDFRLGGTVGALVGNALGGGSQINAGVAVEPDARTFAKPAWPRQIRDAAGGTELRQYFERARAALQIEDFGAALAQPGSNPKARRRRPAKNRALEGMSRILARTQRGARFEHAAIAVNLAPRPGGDQWPSEPCTGCGDCVTGCNHSAKKTLTTTYLPQARAAGARLFTGVTVLRFEPGADGIWLVHCTRTALRDWQRDGVPGIPPTLIKTRRLVLAAGTFGSTEILLRSQCKKSGFGFSATLGHRFSTNGDSIAVGHLMTERVDGVGAGGLAEGPAEFFVGPTITSQIRVDDPDDVERSVLIQEGAIPGALAGLFHEIVTTAATFAQLGEARFRGEKGDAAGAVDHLALDARALTHDQTLLVMGHDRAGGVLSLGGRDGTALTLDYPEVGDQPVFRRQEELLRKVEDQGGIYLANPALQPVPASTADVLSGPSIGGGAFTVHPLGGCPMGDDADHGVVDHCGQVFDPRGGAGAVHAGLVVLDGGIVPCALGVNPLLTITMLAERSLDKLLGRWATTLPPGEKPFRPLPPYPDYRLLPPHPYVNTEPDRIPLQFSEIMRDDPTTRSNRPWRAAMVVHFATRDVKRLFADGVNVLKIERDALACVPKVDSFLTLVRADGTGRYEYAVTGGTVRILPVARTTGLSRLFVKLRVVFTWLIERGFDEVAREFLVRARALVDRLRGASQAQACAQAPPAPVGKVGALGKLRGFWRMVGHAAEERRIDYELTLVEKGTGASHRMEAGKALRYAADRSALVEHLARRLAALGARLVGRRVAYVPLKRRNVWKALGEIDYRVVDQAGNEVAAGSIGLDLVDMGYRFMPQLLNKGDTTNAMISGAGYPLMFARLLIKTRLWDFRLPDHPRELPVEFQSERLRCVPAADSDDEVRFEDVRFPALRIAGATGLTAVSAQPPVTLEVARFRPGQDVATDSKQSPERRGSGKSDPDRGDDSIKLKLTRYARPDGSKPATTVVGGVTRVKSIILLNGFAQSTLPFVAQELERNPGGRDEPNLAEFFYEQGFDVWLFDYRTSSLLDASKLPSSMDDIAMLDVPAAVDHVLARVSDELGPKIRGKPQIYVYAHCVGAAAVAMSLLSGRLRHPDGPSKVAGVALSQMHMLLVAGRSGQSRVLVPPFLRDVLRVDFLRLSAAERRPDAFEAVLDRFFTSLDPEGGEYCPHEFSRIREHPDVTTCKRMSGILAPLLKHDRIRLATHERLPIYFGRANVNLLAHGGKCVEYERLVNEDGQNVYVTEANIRAHLDIPVALVHGGANRLFDVESCRRTIAEIGRVNPGMLAARTYRAIIAPDFAHFDTTIGYGATPDDLMQQQILAPLKSFYDDAWACGERSIAAPVVRPPRSLLRAPLAGPVIGWTRDGASGTRLMRVWIEVDETETEPARHVITLVRGRSGRARAQLWPVLRVPVAGVPEDDQAAEAGPDVRDIDALIRAAGGEPRHAAGQARIAIGVADLAFDPLETEFGKFAVVRMASVHEIAGPAAQKAGAGLPFGVPLVPGELVDLGYPEAMVKRMLATQSPLRVEPLRAAAAVLAGHEPAQVSPRADLLAEHGEAVAQLFATLKFERTLRNQIAREPDPQTYSRAMRQIGPNNCDWALVRRRALTGPADGDPLRFMAGCCRYPGMGFEAARADAALLEMASVARSDTHDFCLMVGDQIYADATAALVDSSSPVEKIALRYRKAWATKGMRAVAGTLPTYMTLDDHEIDDNWSRDRILPPAGSDPARARDHAAALRLYETARGAYSAYQWAHGPRNRLDLPGFNYEFDCGGYPFFVLDTRTRRDRFGTAGAPAVIDPRQLDALVLWLRERRPAPDTPRFVVTGSVLFPGLVAHHSEGSEDLTADTWQLSAAQRRRVLEAVVQSDARNVVFVSGDYHCHAVAELFWDGACRALAIVVPALYAPYPGANAKRWEVLPVEVVDLGHARRVEVRASTGEGSGFAEIEVARQAAGMWKLAATMHCIDFNESVESPRFKPQRRKFTFGSESILRAD